MLPILFSFGKFSLPSFGLFLALGFLYGTFLIWRLARAWDLDEEKILDLILLSFFGGLIGARIYFVLLHPAFFTQDLVRVALITRYPGFSFWGGVLSGSLILYLFSRRLKINFWQIGDIAAVGFLGGIILGNIGCLLGGCAVGVESSFFLSVGVVGLLGKRFPAAAIEAVLIMILLARLWPKALKFHTPGMILSTTLIYFGLIKFVLEFWRDLKVSGQFWLLGYTFSLLLVVAGFLIRYHIQKRSILADLKKMFKNIRQFLMSSENRKNSLERFKKSWYNDPRVFLRDKKISIGWKLRNSRKLLKKFHVKPNPKNFKNY